MADCKKMLGELSDYLDGELQEQLCKELEAHLADCPNCRIMLDSLNKTVSICREGAIEPVPDRLQQCLQDALKEKWAKKRKA